MSEQNVAHASNPNLASRLTLGFSCVGHTYAHLFAPTFFVVALTLETELGMTHGEVISLRKSVV